MIRIRRSGDITAFILVCCIGFLFLVPLLWMLRSSLMAKAAISKYPPEIIPKIILFSNYPETLRAFPFGLYFMNTLQIILFNLIGVLSTATLTAYILSRFDFKGRNLIFTLIIGTMLMPGAVTLIPVFIAWSRLGFFDTYVPLWFTAFLGGGSFNIFLIRQFILTIPKDLDEAAIMDGTGRLKILFVIIVPIIKPVLIAITLFTFIGCWNDVMGPVIYLNDASKYTISIALNFFRGSHGSNYAGIMAASALSMLPAVVLYLLGQRYFVEGIVLSGLKA
jgi:multiple sugar transport system permease protein